MQTDAVGQLVKHMAGPALIEDLLAGIRILHPGGSDRHLPIRIQLLAFPNQPGTAFGCG